MSSIKETVRSVLSSQKLGVLATTGEEYPYTSLIGFVCAEEMNSIIFATMKQTRKYANMQKHPNVTVLINSGTNSTEDFKDAASITVLGKASDVAAENLEKSQKIYLTKFPFLEDFIKDPACVLVKVDVEKFIVVTRFQEVTEIEV